MVEPDRARECYLSGSLGCVVDLCHFPPPLVTLHCDSHGSQEAVVKCSAMDAASLPGIWLCHLSTRPNRNHPFSGLICKMEY